MIGVSIMMVTSGIVMAGAAGPMVERSIPPNGLYGLRVRATRADERVWYDANEASGRDLQRLAGAQVVLGGTVPWIFGERGVMAVAAFLAIGAIGLAIRGTLHANRLLAARRAEDAAASIASD